MADAGSASNDGYHPIGVWTGSIYKKDLPGTRQGSWQLELKTCFVS